MVRAETALQRKRRLEKARRKRDEKKHNESEADKLLRLEKRRKTRKEVKADKNVSSNSTQKHDEILKYDRIYRSQVRAAESPSQREIRLEQDRLHHQEIRQLQKLRGISMELISENECSSQSSSSYIFNQETEEKKKETIFICIDSDNEDTESMKNHFSNNDPVVHKIVEQNGKGWDLDNNRKSTLYIEEIIKTGEENLNCGLNSRMNHLFSSNNPLSCNNESKSVKLTIRPTDEEIKQVKDHIKKFPLIESHNFVEQGIETYLPMGLNVKIMYKLYKKEVPNPVTFDYYRKLFVKSGLKFKPKFLGKCVRCTETSHSSILASHVTSYSNVKSAIFRDVLEAKRLNDILVCSFSLQKSLPTPFLNDPISFYKRPLWTYALRVQQLSNPGQITKKPIVYMWHEAEGKKTANEIASCLYLYLQNVKKKHVIFYSTSCIKEFRSTTLYAMFKYFLSSPESFIDVIDHKFSVPGHPHFEEDMLNNRVDEIFKEYRGNIEQPKDWFGAFRQFQVELVNPEAFYDFENLWKNYLDGEEFFIPEDVTWVQYCKYKRACYKKTWDMRFAFFTFDLKYISSEGLISIKPPKLDRVPITEERKKELVDLFPLLSCAARKFYEQLICEKSPSQKDLDSNPRLKQEILKCGLNSRMNNLVSSNNLLQCSNESKSVELTIRPTDEEIKQVKDHIKKFPLVESHNFVEQGFEKYLPMGLNVKIMYDLYKNEVLNPVSFEYYQEIFVKSELKFKPKFLGKCAMCTETSKTSILASHVTFYSNVKSVIFRDVNEAQRFNDTLVCSFSLQKSLPTPFLNDPISFYKRPLWTYALRVQQLTNLGRITSTKKPTVYMWHEAEGKKTANEIASCLYEYLQNVKEKHVIFYSTSCIEEFRSTTLCAMFKYFLSSSESFIDIIEHKFSVPGHPHGEENLLNDWVDMIFKEYRGNIQQPSDWYSAFRQFHQGLIEVVNPEAFYDFENLWKDHLGGEEFFIPEDVTWVQYNKYKRACYKKTWEMRFAFFTFDLKGLSSEGLINIKPSKLPHIPITEERKKDLTDLFPLMSCAAKKFYEQLICEKSPSQKDLDLCSRLKQESETAGSNQEEQLEEKSSSALKRNFKYFRIGKPVDPVDTEDQGCEIHKDQKFKIDFTRLPVCNSVYKCDSKITEDDQMSILNSYKQIVRYDSKFEFITDLVEMNLTKASGRKDYHVKYYLHSKCCRHRVCQICFCRTIQESKRFVQNILRKYFFLSGKSMEAEEESRSTVTEETNLIVNVLPKNVTKEGKSIPLLKRKFEEVDKQENNDSLKENCIIKEEVDFGIDVLKYENEEEEYVEYLE